MTTYPMHYTDNANSWRRVALLANFFWPGLRLGFLIYAIFPALIIFITAAISMLTGHLIESLITSISFLIYVSPLMLTQRDYRNVSAQLPVTATEKLGFLLLTFWIAVPLLVVASGYVGELASVAVFGKDVALRFEAFERQVMSTYRFLPLTFVVFCVFASYTSTVAVTLYYAVTTKGNRAVAVFVSFIVFSIAISMITGIITAAIGIASGWFSKIATEVNQTELPVALMPMVNIVMAMAALLETAVEAFFLVKLYKYLRNSGF